MLRNFVWGVRHWLLVSCLLFYGCSEPATTGFYPYSPLERAELPPTAQSCLLDEADQVVVEPLENGELRLYLQRFDNSAPIDIYYQLPDGSVYRRTMHQHPEMPADSPYRGQYKEADLPGRWLAEEIHLVVVHGSTVLCPQR